MDSLPTEKPGINPRHTNGKSLFMQTWATFHRYASRLLCFSAIHGFKSVVNIFKATVVALMYSDYQRSTCLFPLQQRPSLCLLSKNINKVFNVAIYNFRSSPLFDIYWNFSWYFLLSYDLLPVTCRVYVTVDKSRPALDERLCPLFEMTEIQNLN